MIIQVGKYQKIDPQKEMHLGHQYERNGERAIEKRCDYCGRYFFFDVKNIDQWGINFKLGFNDVPEKIHCGSSHCCDYHVRVLAHEQNVNKALERGGVKLYRELKQAGVI